MDLLKKGIAEAIGTFVLVFFACGVAALTDGSLVATALTFGLVIVAMAYSIGRISGCHINPAVSLGCLIAKRMTVKEFFVYVASQILGGFVGGVAVFGIAKMGNVYLHGNACNTALDYNVGGLGSISAGGYIGAILVEIILTLVFVYVILNVTSENSGAGKKAGIIIGFTLTLVHLLGIGFTGTSVNPARSIATAVAEAIYNGNTDPLAQVWIFIVAPLAGAALAALLFKVLHKEKKIHVPAGDAGAEKEVSETSETAENK
ncbi:MAG: aquaporin [Clostridia bacterium]|nr:aquaporin [Clostridia bacterium]